MVDRVIVGKLDSTNYGMKVSKPGVNVNTATDKELLFDSTKGRTGQIYAGANNLTFVETVGDGAEALGTANLYNLSFPGSGQDYRGRQIIIDGTTVTLTTASFSPYNGGTYYTTVDNMVTDIDAAMSGTDVDANRRVAGASDYRLRITKDNTDMVISYPNSSLSSLESIVGIPAGTYEQPLVTTSGINYLTATGTTKPSLGYPPLIVLAEKFSGAAESDDDESESFEIISRVNLWETTASHMYPIRAKASLPSIQNTGHTFEVTASERRKGTQIGDPTFRGRRYFDDSGIESQMQNASFFVLRVPVGYGYMTSTYYG